MRKAMSRKAPVRKARDVELLDKLESCEGVAFTGSVWRVTRERLEPTQGHASAGRWDPGTFDVLYTSLSASGAVAEIHFHLTQQPVWPSKLVFFLSEIDVNTEKTLRLLPRKLFDELGVVEERYSSFDYARCQEIADAAQFLGFDGLLVPNARAKAETNLVLFCDSVEPAGIEVVNSKPVNWSDWSAKPK